MEVRAGKKAAGGGARARKGVTCEQCFFRRRGLCALDLGGPCSTFRPDRPEGLVPPRQPALLLREPPEETAPLSHVA